MHLGGAERAAAGADRPAVDATAATVPALATAMARKITGRSSRFELELDPAGLGKVKVSVQIDSQGRLAAHLAFDRADAAAALKGRADELRTALQTAGFDLGGAGLSFTSGGGTGSGGQPSGFADTGAQRAASAFARGAETAAEADKAQPTPSRRAAAGALDLRI
jgi:hypothetical protein